MAVVSVIIPVYNGEKYISEAIDSVLAQTFQDFEVIVVNDGSTDRTEECVLRYGERVVYVRQENAGEGAARNRGLGLAQGVLIAFLDADDVWLPPKLARQVEMAAKHPEYGIFVAQQLLFSAEGLKPACKRKGERNGYILEDFLSGLAFSPSLAMVRRECFEVVGTFWTSRWGADWTMWVRIAARYPVYFMDDVLVKYRRHAGNVSYGDPEAKLQCSLRNIEALQDAILELKARPGLVRAAKFRLHFKHGRDSFYEVDVSRAREKLRLALAIKPFAARAWLYLIFAYIPPFALRAGKKLRQLLRRSFGSHLCKDGSTNNSEQPGGACVRAIR